MIDRFYRQIITIKRKTLTDDGGGAKAENWATLKTIKGLIVQNSGNERRVNEKKTETSSHTLICTKTDIKAVDRIEYNGSVYEVLPVDNPLEMNHHMEVDLQLIR